MSLYEASFRVKHECPYRTVSENHPDLTIREWFMTEHQILELSAPTTPTDELVADIAELGTMLFEASEPDSLYAVVRTSLCSLDDSLIARFEDHNCLYLPPTIYQQGWEHYTVTAFADEHVRNLLGDLDTDRDIEIVSTRPIETTTVSHSQLIKANTLFTGLTGRQLEALRIALEHGYFDQPRGASIAELAEHTAVARSTYEEHLRKAENKVMQNTESFLRLITMGDSGESLRKESTSIVAP